MGEHHSFWGITTYFNPGQYKNKIENYRRFRESCRRQGLPLLCVELAFENKPFELNPQDADIIIGRRSDSVMWQKERLLNIALKELPAQCDKIVWLDADVIFQNDAWVKETAELLEKYKVVQPFEYLVNLPVGVYEGSLDISQASKIMGNALKMSDPVTAKLSDKVLYGHPGIAWASRRDWLEKYGFYDKMVLGSGDDLLSSAFYNQDFLTPSVNLSGPLFKDLRAWEETIYQCVRGNVHYTTGTVFHFWHGHRPFRLLRWRLEMLGKFGFTPQDVRLNKDDCWEWASPKEAMHRWVKDYFVRRNEEGRFLTALWAGLRWLGDHLT